MKAASLDGNNLVIMSQEVFDEAKDITGYANYLKNLKCKYLDGPIFLPNLSVLHTSKMSMTVDGKKVNYWAVYRTTDGWPARPSFTCKLTKVPKKFIISTYYNTVNNRNAGYKYKTILSSDKFTRGDFIIHRVNPYDSSLLFEVNNKKTYLMKDFPSYVKTTYEFETNMTNLDQPCTFGYYDEDYLINGI